MYLCHKCMYQQGSCAFYILPVKAARKAAQSNQCESKILLYQYTPYPSILIPYPHPSSIIESGGREGVGAGWGKIIPRLVRRIAYMAMPLDIIIFKERAQLRKQVSFIDFLCFVR